MSDGLVEGVRRGDQQALTELVEQYTEPLYRGALAAGLAASDAEELVQDTLVTFARKAKDFEGRSTVKTYLFGILYNKASELRRRRQREPVLEAIDEVFEERFFRFGMWCTLPQGPEGAADSAELRGWLDGCLEKLPTAHRAAFFLKEVERESTEAICESLAVTANNLGVILFRARNRLRECLEAKFTGAR